VSKNTGLAVRRRLEASGTIPKVTKTRGKDGKMRSVRHTKRIITNTPNEFQQAQEIVKDLPPNCNGRLLDIITAKRRVGRRRTDQQWERRHIIVPSPEDAIRLYHCRFQELEGIAGIRPASVNLVLTDFPYGAVFLDQLEALAALTQRVLGEGGLFVTYTGKFYLPQVIAAFTKYLTYRWMSASVWDGDPNLLCSFNVISRWKPILIYSKGGWVNRGRWPDVLHENHKEKNWHPWQQPLEEAKCLLSYFSKPGDMVIDPCGGSFTNAEASLRLSRRFVGCDQDAECVSRGLHRLDHARSNMTSGA
jgi:hypothetical protein